MTASIGNLTSALTKGVATRSSARQMSSKASQALNTTEEVASKSLKRKRGQEKDVPVVERSSITASTSTSNSDLSTAASKVKGDTPVAKKAKLEETPAPAKKTEKTTSGNLQITGKFNAPLSNSIQKEYNSMVNAFKNISLRTAKKIDFTGGYISVADLIGYQIGWGKRVIEWYETGIAGKTMVMPGDGFSAWSYSKMATHFYKAYQYDAGSEQATIFHDTTKRIIEIVETEYKSGNLDKEGVWPWQKLASGKWWPLSKWVQVNTVAPFKRAATAINKFA